MVKRCPALRPRLQGSIGWRSEAPPSPGIWVDHDCCRLDDRPLLGDGDWTAALPRLAEVKGAFVLAHWNGERLLLARDGIGERTLYYSWPAGGGIAFASRIRDLPYERRLDSLGLAYYLCCAYIPGSRTLLKGVHELLPGETLEYRGDGVVSGRLWSPPAQPEEALAPPEAELRLLLRVSLEQAVARRLPAEAVGCTLSGGIDSSLVVALLTRMTVAPVWTYSLSFGPEYANELAFSGLVAEHCRTRHQVVELSPQQVVSRLDSVLGSLSKPNGDPLTIPNALLFERAAQDVGVVFNGEGGDPNFGGPKNLPMLLGELYGQGLELEREANYLRSHLKFYDDLREMLSPELWEPLAGGALERELSPYLRAPGQSLIQKLMWLNLLFKGGHHILPKVDAISQPFGVLPRSPLFDRDLVELALRLPATLKLNGAVEKYLLKEAVRNLLPAAVVDRPKSGMMVPVEAWFSGPLLEEARSRLLDGLAPRGIFRREFLESLLEGRLGGLRPRRGVKIWLLIALECWLRSHWDQGASSGL